MKKIFVYIVLLLSTVSCTNLEEEILDEQNGDELLGNEKNIEAIVAPSYAHLRDLQSKGGAWGVLEATTDQLAWPARGADWVDPNKQTLTTHKYDPANTQIRNVWNSFMIGISKTNLSLNYLNKLKQSSTRDGYIAEVRFIRALFMYQTVDNFGQLAFREYSDMDFSKLPQIMNRRQAIDRIVTELNEIIPTLKKKSEVPYGRVSKAAAQMLLAKVYLNNEVYFGEAKWQEVIHLCNEIIESNEYKLADDYWELFQHDNGAYGHNTEAILSIIHDEILGLTGADWVRPTLHYNQKFGNFKSLHNGCCTTETFFNTWDQTDSRFQDKRLINKLGFNQGFLVGQQYSVDGVALKTRTGEPLVFTKEFKIDNSPEQAGVRVVKFAPNPDSPKTGSSGNDFHYYRLSDTYLMRAEAKFRKDGSGLEDINAVRAKRKVAPLSSIDLTKIYNERGYEFYWEHGRRTDMIRFGTYTKARDNKMYETEAFRILLPIPLTTLESTDNIKQNPGY